MDSIQKYFYLINIGLESHPQHDLYKKQFRGYSGMMSFYIKSDLEGTKLFLQSLKVIYFFSLLNHTHTKK